LLDLLNLADNKSLYQPNNQSTSGVFCKHTNGERASLAHGNIHQVQVLPLCNEVFESGIEL